MGFAMTATGERFYCDSDFEQYERARKSTDITISAQDVWFSGSTGSLIPPTKLRPSWLVDVVDDMLDWLNQSEGWDSYSAERISPRAVANAAQFLRGIASFGIPRPFISGDSDGAVSSSWDSDRYSVQIDFHDSSADLFLWDKYVDEQWEGPMASEISRLAPVLWYLSHDAA